MGQVANSIETLINFAKSPALHSGKFKDFILKILPFLGRDMKASKVVFWLFRPSDQRFESIQAYDLVSNKTSTGITPDVSQFSTFMEELKKNYILEVNIEDDRLSYEEFIINYMGERRLKKWVNVQVWNDNHLFGIISLEWNIKKSFTDQDRLTLITASLMISQCYDTLIRVKEEILHKKELDDFKDEEVEKEKLTKKFADHAFYTSHSIRHPLSTILALIELIKINWEKRDAYEKLLSQLKVEIMNLDDAIRIMITKIELDNLD